MATYLYIKNRRNERRLQALSLLGGKCVKCDATEALDFDHVDPGTKIADISDFLLASEEKFWTEVAKCQLLCRPCHIEKSKVDGSFNGGGWNKIEQPVCGTAFSYHSSTCRCVFCTTAYRLYKKGLVDFQEIVDEEMKELNSAHGNAKLRDLDIKYIRKLHELGHTNTAIAAEFGISRPHVSDIVNRKKWAHVL